MMESALIFATIVQLLGVWRAERQIVGKFSLGVKSALDF